jgi:predicted transposase YbfD/YdcC
MQTLQAAFATIPDRRGSHGKRYPLPILLLLVMLGIMSGYRGYRGLSRFMQRHRVTLSARLNLRSQALPDYSTIRRLFQQVDFQAVATVLTGWMTEVGWLQSGDDCAIDGKSLANTLVHHKDAAQNFVSIVSIFQLRDGLVVGQQVFENGKQSEIAVVQSLLAQLEVTGIVFSLDALHLQKKTVKLIHDAGNDYVIGVKANQRNLYRLIVQQSQTQTPASRVIQSRKGHGRQLQRTVSVFDLPDATKRQWAGAQQAIHVYQVGQRQGKPYEANLYYLTSLQQDATRLSTRTQGHWGIENRLHWVKDVVLGEDAASIKQNAPASLMGILRNLALSLFRAHGYPSIVAAIDRLSNDFDQLFPILGLSSA